MMKKIVAVALTALIGLSFVSCGSKEYNGFKVTKGPAKNEVINLPDYEETDSVYVYSYKEETKEFPLILYMAQEKAVRKFLMAIGNKDGMSEATYEADYEPVLSEISAWDWGKKISGLTSEEKETFEKYYDAYIEALKKDENSAPAQYQFADDFATEVWLVVDELAGIADSMYKANNGKGWWDSADEVLDSYKDEIAGCKEFLKTYFPTLTGSISLAFSEK